MLRLFVTVLSGLLPLCLLVMGFRVAFSVGEGRDKPVSSRWRLFGFLVGLVAALVFATLRALVIINQRNFVNMPVLCAAVPIDLLALTATVISTRVTRDWRQHPIRLHCANAIAALCIALTVFYALPDVILQLTIFIDSSTPIFTSDMLLRFLGFILGVIAAVMVAAMAGASYATSGRQYFITAVAINMLIIVIQHTTALIQVMQGSILLWINGTVFTVLVWLINHAHMLIMMQICVFLIPACSSLVIGLKTAPIGKNPAIIRERRALRKRAQHAFVWQLLACCMVILTLTVGVGLMNVKPTLSPPEPYKISSGVATISMKQVNDGHLHRFEYRAQDGTMMRFIIIKKNGGAYGVGLDACENCGDAGYYEKDGKIICRKCDVAINLATIGFKGGCNPIPFPYEAHHGKITIQTADLDALSAHFQ